jgi:hypothetical protein
MELLAKSFERNRIVRKLSPLGDFVSLDPPDPVDAVEEEVDVAASPPYKYLNLHSRRVFSSTSKARFTII